MICNPRGSTHSSYSYFYFYISASSSSSSSSSSSIFPLYLSPHGEAISFSETTRMPTNDFETNRIRRTTFLKLFFITSTKKRRSWSRFVRPLIGFSTRVYAVCRSNVIRMLIKLAVWRLRVDPCNEDEDSSPSFSRCESTVPRESTLA